MGGNVTIEGGYMAGDQPLRTITRACGMILVEAGLTTFQADQIRKHVQDILVAAAEQERMVASSRSLSNSSRLVRGGPSGTRSADPALRVGAHPW